MNILLANDNCLDHGGVSVFMLQWIRGIKELNKNAEVNVYFRGGIVDAFMEEQYAESGAKVYCGNIPLSVGFKNFKARCSVKQSIREIIHSRAIDVVHVNSSIFGFTADIMTEARKNGVPVRVSHVHAICYEKLIDRVIHTFLRYRILKNATVYAGCSQKATEYLFGKKIVNSPLWRIVPNTIDTNRFRFSISERNRVRNELGVDCKDVLLGAVGRLSQEKNQCFLIDILSEMKKAVPSVKLLLLGDGPDRGKIEAYARACGVTEIVYMKGTVNDVSAWLSALDYYLMPSLTEGLPISAVEAQANGLVCVLSDRISDEVDLTENVIHLSIDNGVGEWVRVLEKKEALPLSKREDAVDDIKKAGFDVHDTPIYVKKLYCMEAQ